MSDTEFTLAGIDPIALSLLPGYLARRREELGGLSGLLAERRYAELSVIGHNLSGSGGAYGLPGLSEIGRSIEKAAELGDHDALVIQIDSLTAYLDRLGQELE